MTLLEQAIAFREAFNQEMLVGMTRYGFVKERLLNMHAGQIEEESKEGIKDARDMEGSRNTTANHIEVRKN